MTPLRNPERPGVPMVHHLSRSRAGLAISLVALLITALMFPTTGVRAASVAECSTSYDYSCLLSYGYGGNSTGSWAEKYYRFAASSYHNCTRFAAFYMDRFLGIADPGFSFGDAWNWGLTDAEGGLASRTSLKEMGYEVDQTPAVGAVAWWRTGHVGIVVEVGSGYVTVASDNYAEPVGYTNIKRKYPTGSYPTAFIHVEGPADVDPDEEVDIEVQVSPSSGDTHADFQIGVTGATRHGDVRVRIYDPSNSRVYSRTFEADSSGEVALTWDWDSGDEYGRYKVRAYNLTGDYDSDCGYFTVEEEVDVRVNVSPSSGYTYTNFWIEITGATPRGDVEVRVYSPAGSRIMERTYTANSDGELLVYWRWHSGDGYGRFKARAYNRTGDYDSDYDYFSVAR